MTKEETDQIIKSQYSMRRIVTVKAIYDISDPVFREPGMLTDKKQVEEVIFNEVSNIFLDNEDIMDLQVTCEDI